MAGKILIVDDVAFVRKKLKSIMNQIGARVVGEASNGIEAINSYKLMHPDIVLMDIFMPEMDGISALKSLRSINPNVVVIMISAMGEAAIVKEAVYSGASGFIVKPFEDEKVKKVVAAYL